MPASTRLAARADRGHRRAARGSRRRPPRDRARRGRGAADGACRDLPGAGDVAAAFSKHTLLRPDADRRLLVVGLGKRDELDAERLRIAPPLAVAQAARYEATTIAWALPESGGAGITPASLAAGLVDGTVLASLRFDRFKSRDPDDPAAPAARAPGDLRAGPAADLAEAVTRRAWPPRPRTAPGSSRPCRRTSSPRRTWRTALGRSPTPTTPSRWRCWAATRSPSAAWAD